MRIIVSAESTIDLPREILEQFNIKTVPFTVVMGEQEYLDGEIKNEDIFKFVEMNNILPKTSAVNEVQYSNHFNELLKDYDAIIHISLSSQISSAYQNACNVAKDLNNVYVIDSKSLSTGIALLAIKASEMISEGIELKEIVKTMHMLTEKVQASFILDKLNYLYKGGRCSALSVFGANLLRIKPQILLQNGKMVVGKKYIGNLESVTTKYCDDTLKENAGDKNYAFITYTTATDKMVQIAEEKLKNYGFKTVYKTHAGATITSHCGPHTLGILYIKE